MYDAVCQKCFCWYMATCEEEVEDSGRRCPDCEKEEVNMVINEVEKQVRHAGDTVYVKKIEDLYFIHSDEDKEILGSLAAFVIFHDMNEPEGVYFQS